MMLYGCTSYGKVDLFVIWLHSC